MSKPTVEARNQAIEFHNEAVKLGATDLQTSYRLVCSAVTVDPTCAQAWYFLGNVTADLKQYEASIASFRRALDLPDDVVSGGMNPDLRAKCLVNLGHRLLNAGHVEESLEVSLRAVEFLKKHPEADEEGRAFAWTNVSLVLSILGRTDESLRYAAAAYAQSKKPIVELGLAFAHLYARNWAAGLKHFEARFEFKLRNYLNYPYPRWRGGKERTLYVAPDQGLGDTLSYLRFVPLAAARVEHLTLAVQVELVRMVTAAMGAWPNVRVIPFTSEFPAADCWCPIVGLPTALGLTSGDIEHCPQHWGVPPLDGPDPSAWKVKDARLHVAIAFAGSPDNEIDQHRSIPFVQFFDLCRVVGVQVYSLQVGPKAADLHAAGAVAIIRDLSPWIRDVADTVAILREMDLVITIESFLGHLAGALGKECWIPYSYLGGDYRIGRNPQASGPGRPLWYANHRIFRQGPDCRWQPVFNKIVVALHDRLDRGGGDLLDGTAEAAD